MVVHLTIERGVAMPAVTTVDDADAVADIAVHRLTDVVTEATNQRSIADVVLAGGSTPQSVYARLAARERVDPIDWSGVRLWLGDERVVPEADARSNAGMIRRTLLGDGGSGHGIGVSPDRVHFPIGDGWRPGTEPSVYADRYADELLSTVERDTRGRPVIDLLLAGIGPDGHTLSIFPSSRAMDAVAGHVVGVPAPTHIEPHCARVTLTGRWIDQARHVIVLATGASKADVIGRVFAGPREPRLLPAQLLLRANVEWLLDRDAASQIPERFLAGSALSSMDA